MKFWEQIIFLLLLPPNVLVERRQTNRDGVTIFVSLHLISIRQNSVRLASGAWLHDDIIVFSLPGTPLISDRSHGSQEVPLATFTIPIFGRWHPPQGSTMVRRTLRLLIHHNVDILKIELSWPSKSSLTKYLQHYRHDSLCLSWWPLNFTLLLSGAWIYLLSLTSFNAFRFGVPRLLDSFKFTT